MFTDTRNRETLYGDYVLRHHPDYAGQVPLYYTPDQYFWIEGGDILNLSRRVLGVGISQRTQPEAIEQLASAIFADESSEIDTVLAFEIPSTRASCIWIPCSPRWTWTNSRCIRGSWAPCGSSS